MIGIRLADRCRNDAEIKICLELQEFGTEGVRGSCSVMVLHPALGGLMAAIARWQTEEAVKVGMCKWKFIIREITHEVSVVAVRACEGGDVLIGEALKRWIENKYGVFGVTLVPRDIVSSSALDAVGAHDVEVNCVRQRLTGLRGRG